MPDFYKIGDNPFMIGREDKASNDLFYTCSLIEYISRKTKNSPNIVANALGLQEISKIYDLADVYHCDNIDRVSDDLIAKHHITQGNFDNISTCKYSIPTHWDIGKVYKRLILKLSAHNHTSIPETTLTVFTSEITRLIENYNSSFYYDSPDAIFQTYLNDCRPEGI